MLNDRKTHSRLGTQEGAGEPAASKAGELTSASLPVSPVGQKSEISRAEALDLHSRAKLMNEDSEKSGTPWKYSDDEYFLIEEGSQGITIKRFSSLRVAESAIETIFVSPEGEFIPILVAEDCGEESTPSELLRKLKNSESVVDLRKKAKS